MPYELGPIDAAKNAIVREMFIDTADDNYIVARWCAIEGVNTDFLWLSVHALEKYMKAALLLNEKAKKIRSHDIKILYPMIVELASDLLPSGPLRRPDNLNDIRWHDEDAEAFIMRIHRDGDENSRYRVSGYAIHPDYLHKLDKMVFSIRRLCKPLDAYVLGQKAPDLPDYSNREELAHSPADWKLGAGRMESVIEGKCGTSLRNVLLNCNIPFAPDDFVHTPIPGWSSSLNVALTRYVFEPLREESSGDRRQCAKDIGQWVCDNIILGGTVLGELKEALNHV